VDDIKQSYVTNFLSSLPGVTLPLMSRIVVVPGHSKVGAPLDASATVDFTENLLLAFEEGLKKAKDPDGLIISMKERFPAADFLLALERGAKTNVKP
jgi:hypothetical protein